jgi:hypothetical protein
MTLGNEFTNLRHKINWNFHRGMRCGFKRSLILGYGFFVRLCLVMFEEFADALFIPSFRKFSSAHDFLRRRRRKAFKAFGPRLYAVTTNAASGSGSGT